MPIEIKDVSFIYNKGATFQKTALDGISLTINDGQFIGLIGHTGSGKSTLIQHMNALIAPTTGSVLIDGQDINADKKQLKAIRQKVGLVFQYPEHQLFETTVYREVAYGPSNMDLSESEIKERVESALKAVGLSESLYEKSPFALSGGQKRRVAIAGVIAMRPKILILDEPTAGLDPVGREEILALISKMHKELNITVILVSHSMEDVARLADQIIVMDKGRVFCTGTPKEVFMRTAELNEIGLMAPQISRLMLALKERGFDTSTDIFTVEQASDLLYNLFKNEVL